MKEDELKIEFEILIEEIHGFKNPARIKIKDGKLLKEFGNILNDSKFTDVTIITADKKELRAHKNILAARSKVFEAMFDHELEESKLNQVYINDFNEEVIRQMLQYSYTGKLTKLDDLNADLLAIAHKYELQELEEMCVNSLLEKLSIETAAEAFKLGDLYTYQILKESAVNMMKQHAASWIREDASNEPQVLVNISEIITNLQKLKEAEDCKDEQ
ncbi:speckle-type POZ protein-like [Drosophila busckii]|uniref:speckle-type POZ protein-like n=1 Tax=Drosophila busckii TaxID=30019 RepID=UPI001432ED3E|nr:speckle-type POZ protein-like [Drosophila busckii]